MKTPETGNSRVQPGAPPARILTGFLRLFFHYFYHQFAWTYDAVAAVVSLGRWNRWVAAAIPFLAGRDILEVGFGPGHLQVQLLADRRLNVAGLDESRQMGALSRRRLVAAGINQGGLARGWAQELPFAEFSFDSVVSTFPSEYIFDPATLVEVRRVLRPGGRFVIVPAAWIVGRGLSDRAAAWLFKITRQAPSEPSAVLKHHVESRLQQAGFSVRFDTVEVKASVVLIVTASKAPSE